MLSMRYLIVSLAAVFLALGIGIFIGFMFDGHEIFLNQQEVLIDELEYKLDEIRGNNQELLEVIEEKDKQVQNYEYFTNKTFTKLIEGKLKDMKIAIIETNDDYTYNDINSAVMKSGGIVSSTTYIKKDFLLEDEEKLNEIYDYFHKEKQVMVSKEKSTYLLSEYIATSIIEKDLDTLQYLKKEGLIDLKGNYMDNIDYFIIAGGSAEKNYEDLIENIDIPIIKKIKQYNIPIIGVEHSNTIFSYIDSYKKQKISTIDNADTLIGQYSIIEVFQGNYGNFGIKPSADGLIPQ